MMAFQSMRQKKALIIPMCSQMLILLMASATRCCSFIRVSGTYAGNGGIGFAVASSHIDCLLGN
jgi:hypothetical protein